MSTEILLLFLYFKFFHPPPLFGSLASILQTLEEKLSLLQLALQLCHVPFNIRVEE